MNRQVGSGLPFPVQLAWFHHCTARISELSNRTREKYYETQVRLCCMKGEPKSDYPIARVTHRNGLHVFS